MIPFADAHSHSNPMAGIGASEIAKKFKREGGWFISLVSLSPRHYGIERCDLEGYKRSIEVHVSECKKARERGLEVVCLAGFHPSDVDFLVDKVGMDVSRVLDLGKEVIDLVMSLCREGILDGIGEVGRQHYITKPSRVLVSDRLMEYSLLRAKELDCIVHLHLENEGKFTVLDVASKIRSIEASPERVILHHVKPGALEDAIEEGLSVTVPGLLRVLEEALKRVGPFFMIESDFIDDPKRPGVVVYPWKIIENQKKLLKAGLIDEDGLAKLNVDEIVRHYRVRPP